MDATGFSALAAKAGLVWVSRTQGGPVPLWFSWHEGAIHLVVGGGEQPDPFDDLPAEAWVTVPSKDTGASAGLARVRAEVLPSDSEAWTAATAALSAARLNTTDADLLGSWRENSRVLRLEVLELIGEVANDELGGRQPVSVEPVRPRGWRPMRAHLRRRR